MSVAVSTIAADVAELLLDEDYDRWDTDFHLESANEAERQATILKPDVYVTTRAFVLVEGTRQSIPSDGVQLINITRNMGAAGATEGSAITLVAKADMDAMRPDWHSSTYESATVEHFMFDERDPLKFWVYPAQPSTPYYVEGVFGAYPTPISAISSNINLPDIYRDAYKYYMLFRAYSLDAANSQFAAQRAQQAWNLFVTILDRKDMIEQMYSPKQERRANGNNNQ